MKYFVCSLLAALTVTAVGQARPPLSPIKPLKSNAQVAGASSTGTSYFVSTAGDDGNDGLTIATTWRTIAKVNSQPFSPGDTISFRRGDTWNAQTDAALIVSSSGSAGNPITFTSYDSGPLPIIDGEGVVGNVLQTNSHGFIVIDSLQVQNSQNYLLYVNNCDSCSITNNTLMNGGLYGIEVTGTSPNITITGNSYSLTAGFAEIGPGIDCNTASLPGCVISNNSVDLRNVAATQSPSGILCRNSGTCTITGNTVQMANADQGIGLKASGAGHMTGSQIVGNSIVGVAYTSSCGVANGCDAEGIELTGYDANHLVMNSLISNNYIQNSSGTSSDCIGVDRAGSNTISYNICLAPPTQGSIMHVSGLGTTGNLIYGNSAYGSQQGMTFLGTAVTNNTVENNIMVGATLRGINFQLGATGTYDYNLAWHNGTGVGTSDNYVGGTDGGHNLVADPQWTNSPPASGDDFKLLSTSPAVDSGADLGVPYQMADDPNSAFPYTQVDQDLHGNWERGAFIYADPSNSAVATLSPTAVTFASQPVGSNSNPSGIQITNTGTAALNIASIAIGGTDASQFSMTQTCGSALAAGASCNVSVTFSPASTGTKSAAMSISDDAAGSPQSVPLSGTGSAPAAPEVALAPSSLPFGNQTTGTTSNSQSVTVTNSGTGTLNITSILVSGIDTTQFAATQTCGTSLAAGATCSVSVTFSPTLTGTKSAAVSIVDDATDSPQLVPLSGSGTAPASPAAGLAPSSLIFGNQTLGTSSVAQSIVLTNTGTAVMNVSSIATTGTDAAQFTKTQTCGATVAAGATCTVSVVFSPTSTGAKSAAVTISDDATGSPQSVPLSGTGTAPAVPGVGLTPSTLPFANQTQGTSSVPQLITLTNTGTAVLNITNTAIAGTDATQFTKTQTCGATLAAGATCTVSVVFSPTSTGAKSAAVAISDNANGSPHTVPLSGTGTTPAVPAVGLAPSSLAFGNQSVGTSSASRSITLTNSGNAVLSIAGIAITGTGAAQFTKTQTCGTTLAAGRNCTISVIFSPTSTGAKSAAISITDNAAASPQAVGLTGTSIGTTASLSATTLAFATQAVSTTSASKSLTLTNTGSGRLNIASIVINGANSGDFSQTSNCGTSLAAKAACTITLTFTPSALGTRSANLTVTDDATNSPQAAALSGSGVAQVTLSASSLSFGTVAIGSSSSTKSVTLANNRSTALSVTGLVVTGTNRGDFSQTNNCASVAAKGSCVITVTFRPTATGARSAAVTITDNANNSPQTISLSGSGVVAVTVSPTSLSFGTVTRGSTSSAQSITLTNNKSAALTISSIAISGTNRADFSQTNTCGTSVSALASCTISVKFKPTAASARSAAVTITDVASNSPQTVPLTGTGK